MSKKRKEEERRRKEQSRKRAVKSILVAAGVVCVCAALFAVLYVSLRPKTIRVTPMANGDLSIPYSGIGSKVSYVDFGGSQNLLVRLDGSGIPVTAYDTCEECFSSGRAHYTQSGEELTCQSCGNSVSLLTLGAASWGGCQPVAIPAGYRQDADGNIVIPAAVLDYADDVFAAWTAGDYSVRLSGYGDLVSDSGEEEAPTEQSGGTEQPEEEGGAE